MFNQILRYRKIIGLAVSFSIIFLCLNYWVIYFFSFVQNVFLSLFFFCLITIFFVFVLARQKNLTEHCFVAVPSAAIIFSFLSIIVTILTEPFCNWNSARLAWTFSIKHGYQVFYGLSEGPILARMYGPLMPLSYWPCTWMKSPTSAICLGSFLSVLFIFIPSISFFVMEAKKESSYKDAFFYYFLFLCLFSFNSYPLSRSIFMIHADAPSLGLAAFACFFLYREKAASKGYCRIFSAFFVACSIWTKQSAVPLAIAFPVYIWAKEGKRAAQIYFLQIVLFLVSLLIVFSHLFGFKKMFEEMIFIPSRHPSRYPGGWLRGFLPTAGYFVKNTIVFIVIIVLVNIDKIISLLRKRINFKEFLKENEWVLFFWVGVAMAPMAILSRLKEGGDVNNFSFSVYFFVLGATICLVPFLLKEFKESSWRRRNLAKSLFCILIFCLMLFCFNTSYLHLGSVIAMDQNPQEEAYTFSLQNPEAVYFPDNILSTYFSDKKVYHSLDGIFDRKNAKIPIDSQHFKRYLPRKLKEIAIPKRYLWRHAYVLEKFPEFYLQKESKKTFFWTVYEKQ